MFTYNVQVKKQGLVVDTVEVEAENGGQACRNAEKKLGLKPAHVSFGPKHEMVVTGWHGFEFLACRA